MSGQAMAEGDAAGLWARWRRSGCSIWCSKGSSSTRRKKILLKQEHGANVVAWESEDEAAVEAMFRKQTGSTT